MPFELATLVTRLGLVGLEESISGIASVGASMDELALKGRGIRATFLYLGFGAMQMARMSGAASRYLMGFVKKSVKVYADYEQSLRRTAVISEATAVETKMLGDTFVELGMQTEWTVTQVGDAAQQLALAGFKVDEILTALPSTLALATIGLLDTAQAAKFAAQLLRGFRLEADNLSYVVNVLSYAITNSLNTMHDLQIAMPYVAGTAAELGYSIESVTAALMELGNAGIVASKAGMALRTGLVRIAKATGIIKGESMSATDVIRKYGFQFETQSGQLKDLAGIIDELNDKLAGLSEQEKIVALNSLVGLRYGSYFLMLMEKGGDAIRENEKAMKAQAIKQALVSRGFANVAYVLRYWRAQVKEGADYTRYFTDVLGMSEEEAKALNQVLHANADEFDSYVRAIERAKTAEEKRLDLLRTWEGLLKLIRSRLEALYIMYADKMIPALKLVGELSRDVLGIFLKIPGKGLTSNIILMVGATAALTSAVFSVIYPLAMMSSAIGILAVKYDKTLTTTDLLTKGLQMLRTAFNQYIGSAIKGVFYLYILYKIAQTTKVIYDALEATFGKSVATVGALTFAFASLVAVTDLFWKVNLINAAKNAIPVFLSAIRTLISTIQAQVAALNAELSLTNMLMGPIGWAILALGVAGFSYYAIKRRAAAAPPVTPTPVPTTTQRNTYITVDVHGNTVANDEEFARLVGEQVRENVLRAHDSEYERAIG